MTWELHRHDARHVSTLLEPESVALIVTSPPYFALRSYQDGGEHYDGQIGSEPTPTEFLDALIACTADWVRVLRPSGSIFVNLGDKYAGSGGHNNDGLSPKSTLRGNGHVGGGPRIRATKRSAPDSYNKASDGIPAKSLMGLPWRYAIRCIDELGLILRAEIVWSKPNGLPESVTDRVRRSHEQWFHFTKQGHYFAAIDEVREPQQSIGERHEGRSGYVNALGVAGGEGVARSFTERDLNPLGKVPGSVWSIPSEPLIAPRYRIVQSGRHVAYPDTLDEAWKVMRGLGVRGGRPSLRTLPDHFAAFPSEWPRRIILGWSPSGYCTACDQPRRPLVDKRYELAQATNNPYVTQGRMGGEVAFERKTQETTITGYACACPQHGDPAPTRPAVVLDPFAGTGTTVAVAHRLGRHGIGTDLSADYLRLAEWRCASDTRLRDKVFGRTGLPAAPKVYANGGEQMGFDL